MLPYKKWYRSARNTIMSLMHCMLVLAAFWPLLKAAPTQSDQQQLHGPQSRFKRAATARLDRLWDDAVIPYEIDPIFSEDRASLFRSAMRHWENSTCIKFVERVPDEHRNYIVFTERSCGCCSFVGKRGNGAQAISIGKHCDKFGIVVHELGHVVGFWHEHTRPDRDQHVQIIGKNIMAGQEYNFNKLTKEDVNSLGLAYDYDSILHYATNTFAKDTYLDTILPLHEYLNTEEANQTPSVPQQQTTTTIPTTTSSASASTTVFLSSTASTGGSHSANRSSNATSPHMINDELQRNSTRLGEIYSKIEQDFQSMLQFHGTSRNRPTRDKSNILILDGSVLVRLGNGRKDSSAELSRNTRGASPVDADDSQMMLSMDNMLAKTRPEIGQRVRLSVGDVAQTNLLYRCPKCGRTIQQLSGTFHSPNYFSITTSQDKANILSHAQHGSNPKDSEGSASMESCEWRLAVGVGERIMINLTDLDLGPPITSETKPSSTSVPSRIGMPRGALTDQELRQTYEKLHSFPAHHQAAANPMIMTNCATDYLEVRDGYTPRAPIIARLCGHISAIRDSLRPIVSTSNRLLVSLRLSHLSAGKRGFLAQHDTVCGGYIMLGNAIIDQMIQTTGDIGPSPSHHQTVSPSTTNTRSQQASTNSQLNGSTAAPAIVAPNHRSLINGSLPSENEVPLSSQTNAHGYRSHQQHAQSDATPLPLPSTLVAIGSETAPQMNTPRAASWNQWPPLNTSILQTPNWPEHYRASRECVWVIKAEENHQISMHFESFDLEPHDSCAYDYVEIRDGESMSNNPLGRFCGNRLPEQILSSGRTMLVKFVSDSDVNKAGFLASLRPELDECKLGTDGCKHKCSNSVVPYKCECPNGEELAPDGKSCVPTCGGIRNESSGQITSPSFPDLYPISTKCVWEITAPAHHRVTLNFTHFDLEGIKAQECEYDYVDIWSRMSDGKYVKNGIFCGPNQAFTVTSVANVMRVGFNSDNSIQKSGFEANYFIDRDECAENNGGCRHICTNNIGSYQCSCNNGFVLHENKHDCIGSHCLHTITEPDGNFQSPNFPNPYQPNKECAWIFSTAPGHRIKLIFDQFDLESHQECAYDHVAVFDGESMDDHALGRFCGSRRPLTLVSSYNLLYLVFRSDATNEKRGFNATHSTMCGGRLPANLNQFDLIYSHPQFNGTTHYNRNEDCDWIIEANENQKVRIEFTYFALEADSNCNYDQTIVYDGTDDSARPLALLCGTDIPKERLKITSTRESMLIVFKSDDSINSRGFSLTYTAIEMSDDELVAISNPTNTKLIHTS